MAQDRLSRYAAAPALLVGGAAVEVAADQSLGAGLADWVVGAAFVLAALARRRGSADQVALLAAALWFLATLALTPDGWWHALDGPLALAYRGPVLHLLARPPATGRLRWPVLVAAYGAPLLVATWTGWLTALVAGVLAALIARRDRLSAAVLATAGRRLGGDALGRLDGLVGRRRSRGGGRRRRAGGTGRAGIAPWPAWWSSSARTTGRPRPVRRTGRGARRPGPAHRRLPAGRGVARRRRSAGGPPDLDEDAGQVTVVPVPGGGSLALVHGPGASPDPDLSAAAARAAVLVLERVRVGTQIRLTAEEVRRSAARLLAVDEQDQGRSSPLEQTMGRGDPSGEHRGEVTAFVW